LIRNTMDFKQEEIWSNPGFKNPGFLFV
jgi:hypothetical protein